MKNVIVYLVRGDKKSLVSLKRSLELLKRNFLPWNPTDVLVFHESNVTDFTIRSCFPEINVLCALVDFSSRPHGEGIMETPRNMSLGGWGYRHMCNFFANGIFLRHELDGYDYQMRMDDDSYILSPVKYNVFEKMRSNGIKYCYRSVEWDLPDVCDGLRAVAIEYFKRIGARIPRRRFSLYVPTYYTNFEINDLQFFRSKSWQGFAKTIVESNGIWNCRWGDAPIRYLGVNGLLSPSEVLQLTDLHYFHQGEWLTGHTRRKRWMAHEIDFLRFYLTYKFGKAIKRIKTS